MKETLFLSQWIQRAIDGVDLSAFATNEFLSSTFGADPSQWPARIRKSVGLCSDDYLFSALRVARSLADRICEAEDFAKDGNSNLRLRLPSLPPPGSSWVDRVLVHLSLNDANELRFNIELLAAATDEGHLEDNMQRIHSLGMVFYEIFSGGERPVEELKQNSQTETEELPQELPPGNLDPLPLDEVLPIDEAGVLRRLDDDIDDENDRQDDNGAYVDATLQGENPRKKRIQSCKHKRFVSVEPLKTKCLPGALCDLIANMMNCTNGTLNGEDAYQNMSEIRSDLQLMLDKPEIYFYDQDMGRFAATGLQRGETMFGRKAELSTIMDAYRRSISSESESVIIFGPSGSGKSFLAHETGKHVVAEGGFFLYGKFDQLQQGKPFGGLASAFDEYCAYMINDDGLDWMRLMVAYQLTSILGSDAYHLTKIIPNLKTILGPEPPDFNHDEACFNAQKRLQYLLCRFVEVISITSGGPMTLCLDDLQWADAASIAALNQLLVTGAPSSLKTPFFFLGCYREGATANCNPFWDEKSNGDLLNVRTTKVKLGYMDEETVNALVSETLGLSPRLIRGLTSIIYLKTKGNPLFVSRLLISLSKEGLLQPSLSRRRWVWDLEKIQCQKMPDDVAMLLTHSIGALPEDVKSSLFVMSCFGASVEVEFVKILERALNKSFLNDLDVAVAEGLLDKIDDQYRFSHDLIQEAAYNMIVQDRNLFHFQYGIALSSQSIGIDDNATLFRTANQLNLGGPEAVEHNSQNILVARINLRAGKRAMEMSDFGTAYSFFDNGISFLRKDHWKEHYNLSLELFELASHCALANGDVVSLRLLSEQVLRYGHSFEEKLNVLYCSTCSLAFTSLSESIEKALEILAKLGVDVRTHGSSIDDCVQETKDLLSRHNNDEILNIRQMTDPTMIMAMKFLGKLQGGMSQIMPKSLPFVTQKIIQLSLLHGMSPLSPTGFVFFGSYMAKLGDIRGGYQYVKLAISLLDKVGSRESAGTVFCIGTQVRTYVEPIQAAIEYHHDGYAAAMRAGNVNMAVLNKLLFCGASFFAGVNLQIMQQKYAETQQMMEERNQLIFLIQHQQPQRSLFKLIGTDEEPKYISEEQSILATNASVWRTHCYHKAYISFMFRSYDDATEHAENYFACRDNAWASLLFADAVHTFYIGLISFRAAKESREQQRERWYQRGHQSKVALKRWADSSLWTYENKWYLLEAEESFCNNEFEAAKSFYEKAISSAKDHKFLNEEALACELAAYFYFEIKERQKSVGYFKLAHEKYMEWGAFGKCDSIFDFVTQLLS